MNMTEKKKAKFERVTEKYTDKSTSTIQSFVSHSNFKRGSFYIFEESGAGSIIGPTFRVHSLCTSYCGILFIGSGGGRVR